MNIRAIREKGVKGLNRKGSGKKGKANRYRFQGFTERLSSVNVDVSHRILGVELDPGELNSFFLLAFDKWREVDSSPEYKAFVYAVGHEIQSLPLILHHRERIVDCLIEHVTIPNSQARPPLLDLIGTLARDLRGEMYPYFGKMMTALLSIMDPQNPEELERIFICLSYLLKYLMRELMNDVEQVYRKYFQSIISHPKDYIRRFAAESFAFLLRKLTKKRFRVVISDVLSVQAVEGDTDLIVDDNFCDGLSALLFYTVKGVQLGFNSRVDWMLPQMLQLLGQSSSTHTKHSAAAIVERDMRATIVPLACRRMANHGRRDTAGPIWDVLIPYTTALLQQLHTTTNAFVKGKTVTKKLKSQTVWQCHEVQQVLHVVDVWAKHRHGSRVAEHIPLIQVVERALGNDTMTALAAIPWVDSSGCLQSAVSLFISLWNNPRLTERMYEAMVPSLKSILALTSFPAVLRFTVSQLKDVGPFKELAVRDVLRLAEQLLKQTPATAGTTSKTIPEPAANAVSVLLEILGSPSPLNQRWFDVENEFWDQPASQMNLQLHLSSSSEVMKHIMSTFQAFADDPRKAIFGASQASAATATAQPMLFNLIIVLAVLAVAFAGVPSSSTISAAIKDTETGFEGLNLNVAVPFNVKDYVIGFKYAIKDKLLGANSLNSLFAKKSFDVADGTATVNAGFDLSSKKLSVDSEWSVADESLTLSASGDSEDKLTSVGFTKLMTVLDDKKVKLQATYDMLKKTFETTTSINVDAATIKMDYSGASQDPRITIDYDVDDRTSVSPSISGLGNSADITLTRKWDGGSLASTVDMDKNVKLTWKDSGVGGEWTTVAELPLNDRSATKVSLSRDWDC